MGEGKAQEFAVSGGKDFAVTFWVAVVERDAIFLSPEDGSPRG
jgi:hypothetical protein